MRVGFCFAVDFSLLKVKDKFSKVNSRKQPSQVVALGIQDIKKK